MPEQSLDSLLELDSVQEPTLADLREAGFDLLGDIAHATRNDLRNIGDINTSTAVDILRFLEREGYREPREVTENQQQLQQLLRDLFQFDAADLDFGIYRILNQRRDIIDDFIEEDLIRTVHDALDAVATEERAELQDAVTEARAEVVEQLNEDVFTEDGDIKDEFRDFGVAEDYIAARERLEQFEVAEETEARIFNDLHRFFSRFYERGDFHAKRRFSSQDAKFMVPYNGEEVFFHWANRDQYYVKTSEHFTTYRFSADGFSVEFTVEDANVPQDDVKGDERYFILGNNPVSWDEDEQTLTVTFQYRLITQDEADAFVDTYNEVTGEDRSSFNHKTNTILCTALHQQILDHLDDQAPRETLQREDDGKTVLMQHLTRYTSENTMDYFVHKDLGSFLRDELDYYIQNELLDTDELIKADADRDPHSLRRARVVHKIADRIITFLDQIESFQKRLFEKRKFVTQTDYMVTLDKVPDRLYSKILENEEQLEQWHDVYNTDEWQGDLSWQGEFTEDVLNDNPHLMIDTALFGDEFKHELLASFNDISEATDGTLIHGENFQALNLLLEKYRNSVDCCYIDPPFNTENDEFVYKDNYQHSSWLSMMFDRLRATNPLLSDDGVFMSSIDDNQQHTLRMMCSSIFDNFMGDILWKSRQSVDSRPKSNLSNDHEFVLAYGKRLRGGEKDLDKFSNPDDDPRGPWRSADMTGLATEEERPNLHYNLTDPETGITYPCPSRGWRFDEETMQQKIEEDRILFPDDPEKRPRHKLFQNEMDSLYTGYSSVQEIVNLYAADEAHEAMEPSTRVYTAHGTRELTDLFGEETVDFPKPTELIRELVEQAEAEDGVVLDFFAGSGTTGEAVIRLNEEDDGNRQYVLAEVAEYFDTVLRPRLQKICLSKNWEEGIPEDKDGNSQIIKYHRIESYEDALNNVVLEEPEDEQQQRLVQEQREEYVSGYMLDFEAEGTSLLEPVTLEHPFNYELEIEENGTGQEPTTVDLVETFHYLLGASVHEYETHEHQDRQYVVTRCSVETENGVDTVLTVWRDADDLDLEQERDWFTEQFETDQFDRIYVNSESFVSGAEPVEVMFKEQMEAGHDGAK
jgi:adenine-specific DNA-methyltransferase